MNASRGCKSCEEKLREIFAPKVNSLSSELEEIIKNYAGEGNGIFVKKVVKLFKTKWLEMLEDEPLEKGFHDDDKTTNCPVCSPTIMRNQLRQELRQQISKEE